MLQQPFEQDDKLITIHTSEPNDDIFPFGILETTTTNENNKTTTSSPILGNNLVSEKVFNTPAECKEYIRSKPYELILALICNTLEMKEKWEKEQQELLKIKQNEVQS